MWEYSKRELALHKLAQLAVLPTPSCLFVEVKQCTSGSLTVQRTQTVLQDQNLYWHPSPTRGGPCILSPLTWSSVPADRARVWPAAAF